MVRGMGFRTVSHLYCLIKLMRHICIRIVLDFVSLGQPPCLLHFAQSFLQLWTMHGPSALEQQVSTAASMTALLIVSQCFVASEMLWNGSGEQSEICARLNDMAARRLDRSALRLKPLTLSRRWGRTPRLCFRAGGRMRERNEVRTSRWSGQPSAPHITLVICMSWSSTALTRT